MKSMRIGLYGLGEAGALFASDLLAAGDQVYAYDPADVPTPPGVHRLEQPEAVASEVELLLGVTAASDALTALRQGINALPAASLYADVASAAPALKRELATIAQSAGRDFCDVALLAIVPGNGIRARALAAGSGAQRFVDIMAVRGMPVTSIGTEAGTAAARKLLRSVTMKGLAAVLVESLQAARACGCEDWLWDNLADQMGTADAAMLARLVQGTGVHATRRLHEMEATRDLLVELEVPATMTLATIASLRRCANEGVPPVPGQQGQ